jgi:ABC-type multidrug transport system fused ATPase/permease subunit
MASTSHTDCIAREDDSLFAHMRCARWRIGFTYGLTAIENIVELLYPLAIGFAINGLLAQQPSTLWPLAALWFGHIVLAAGRQLYDTRLFAPLYAGLAVDMANAQRSAGQSAGEVTARVDMAHEYVDFFETDIPRLGAVAISLIGGVALLTSFDPLSGGIVAALLLPVAAINLWLARRSIRLNRSINDQQEQQVDVIALAGLRPLKRHFGRIARWRIRLSNADAASWTLAETITLGAVLLVLWRLAGLPDATAGSIFAGVAYLLQVIDSLDHAPDATQQISRLIDIRRRMGMSGVAE